MIALLRISDKRILTASDDGETLYVPLLARRLCLLVQAMMTTRYILRSSRKKGRAVIQILVGN